MHTLCTLSLSPCSHVVLARSPSHRLQPHYVAGGRRHGCLRSHKDARVLRGPSQGGRERCQWGLRPPHHWLISRGCVRGAWFLRSDFMNACCRYLNTNRLPGRPGRGDKEPGGEQQPFFSVRDRNCGGTSTCQSSRRPRRSTHARRHTHAHTFV